MRFRPLVAPLALLLAVQSSAIARPLDHTERLMVAHIRAGHERSVALLQKLVDINSGTMNIAGVQQVGNVMQRQLQSLGFTVRWISMSAVGRAGHLIAECRSGRGPRILLIGHLDTVFETESPFQSFSRHGDLATGPGVNDMKGGLVVMLTALHALKSAGALRLADLTILLSGDEERPGAPLSISRRDLRAAGNASDIALEFEPMIRVDGADALAVARRSLSFWTLRVHGRAGHSSQIFGADYGYGAAYELVRILDEFRAELPEPQLTYNVGMAVAGSTAEVSGDGTVGRVAGKPNVIPATAFASGDLRTLSDEQTNRVRVRMRAIVARNLPETDAEMEFQDDYPAMAPTEGNRALLARLNQVNADLGLSRVEEADPSLRGAGDISFVAAHVAGLVGMGIAGEGAHSTRETADLRSLDSQAERAALLIYRLSSEQVPRHPAN